MSNKWMQRLGHLYTRIQKDDISGMGAQITYYLVLSFFPFLLFLVSIIGFASMNLHDTLSLLTDILPIAAHDFIVGFITDLQTGSSTALLSFGMIATIWSSSKGILAILKGLNRAFDIEETRPFWKSRLLSYIFTLLLGFVILFSLVLLIFGRVLAEQLFANFLMPENFDSIWGYAQYLIPLTSMIIVFIALYKILPNKHVPLKTSVPGALFATFSWIIASLLFSVYVNNFGNYSTTYGSIGGIIVFLIWLYISSMIILLGGHINAMLTRENEGRPLEPAEWPNIPFLFPKKR